jgi:ADP-ribosyl-[dinitrogen reductase] hydrolase
MSEADTVLRAQGCMLGQIAGDALGSMVEFKSAREIERLYPGGPNLIEGSRRFATLPGQPTDDSELAILLARSIVSAGRYDQEAAARAYAWWYESHPFDIGGATRQALSAGSRGRKEGKPVAPAEEAGADQATEANGALMRVSPLGVYGWRLEESALSELARQDCRLTHPSKVCQDANVAYVLTIARAIGTGETGADLHSHARSAAERLKLHPKVVNAIANAEAAPPADFMIHQGWVLVALQSAFYQLTHATSFEEGVVDTVRRGGDTDTNAAVAGALLGAVHGPAAVPRQWRDAILSCTPDKASPAVRQPRPRELWPVDCLEIAVGLCEHAQKAGPP